ncbi:hypothetical protein L208DRAFT_292943 [Tricholoma matsutake]|nr:hypothetical protein L208DRAFT_292943 [Tricholoma matsutake 945]
MAGKLTVGMANGSDKQRQEHQNPPPPRYKCERVGLFFFFSFFLFFFFFLFILMFFFVSLLNPTAASTCSQSVNVNNFIYYIIQFRHKNWLKPV